MITSSLLYDVIGKISQFDVPGTSSLCVWREYYYNTVAAAIEQASFLKQEIVKEGRCGNIRKPF